MGRIGEPRQSLWFEHRSQLRLPDGSRRPGRARRHRGTQVALLAAVIVLGLASRRYADALSPPIARYAGDTLWATAAYVALSVVWPCARVRWLAAGAALISLAVELSQLAHPAWLQRAREWPGAALLLGYGFVASDLVCYAVGVALGAALDQSARFAARWR